MTLIGKRNIKLKDAKKVDSSYKIKGVTTIDVKFILPVYLLPIQNATLPLVEDLSFFIPHFVKTMNSGWILCLYFCLLVTKTTHQHWHNPCAWRSFISFHSFSSFIPFFIYSKWKTTHFLLVSAPASWYLAASIPKCPKHLLLQDKPTNML